MIIEPLKDFFGRDDCFALMIKPLGFGQSEKEALSALEYALDAVAESLQRNRPHAERVS